MMHFCHQATVKRITHVNSCVEDGFRWCCLPLQFYSARKENLDSTTGLEIISMSRNSTRSIPIRLSPHTHTDQKHCISFLQDFPDGLFPAGGKSDIEGIFPPPYFEWFQFEKVSLPVYSGSPIHCECAIFYSLSSTKEVIFLTALELIRISRSTQTWKNVSSICASTLWAKAPSMVYSDSLRYSLLLPWFLAVRCSCRFRCKMQLSKWSRSKVRRWSLIASLC